MTDNSWYYQNKKENDIVFVKNNGIYKFHQDPGQESAGRIHLDYNEMMKVERDTLEALKGLL